ncbi:zinc ribbon domain-containing protein [Eubacteriales bacterium OttesenSCG-928-N13]|nr:zinc ribbon domain-containing protein [Eubacteriales bacterium OttesenSCG-928-N13]
MSNLSDKVSYLRGLAEGLSVGDGSSEGKLIVQLIDMLSEAVEEIDELREAFDELSDYVESIDEDLSELEGDFDDDDFDFDDEDEDFDDIIDEDEDEDELDFFMPDDDDDEDEDEGIGMYVGCICPKCNGMFCVDAVEDEDNQMYVCPHCGETVEAHTMDNDNVPVAKAFKDPEDE